MVLVLARVFRHHKTGNVDSLGFEERFVRYSVIADERIGAHKYLARERWIGKALNVPRHTRREDDLARSERRPSSLVSKALTFEHRIVLEEELHSEDARRQGSFAVPFLPAPAP